MTNTLHWARATCTAQEALATLTGRWTVFVSTPDTFTVATTDALPPLGRCFQLHAFNGDAELRWLAEGATGRAVWLAESAAALPTPATGSNYYLDRVRTQSVLWGTPAAGPAEPGMSRWFEARVGEAQYPCDPGRPHTKDADHHDRAVLVGVDYIAEADEHGNATVIEHRLVEIKTVNLKVST